MVRLISEDDVNKDVCLWCGAGLPAIDGPTHKYMQSSASCWAAFGRVLSKEYSDQQYFEVHRLAVDAYAVQHPGIESRQSIQSVGVHLVRLCLFLEHGLEATQANDAMLAAAQQKASYHWLEPPGSMGVLTASDVDAATNAAEHKMLVKRWAEQMWRAWSDHHETVRKWATLTSVFALVLPMV